MSETNGVAAEQTDAGDVLERSDGAATDAAASALQAANVRSIDAVGDALWL